MHATTVAIDLAKEVFELAYADAAGHAVCARRRAGPDRCARNRDDADRNGAARIQRARPAQPTPATGRWRRPDRRHRDERVRRRIRTLPVRAPVRQLPRPDPARTLQRANTTPGRVTKRGDVYLRMLLIHGARASLRSAHLARKKGAPLDRTQTWALALAERAGHNKAAVARANKTARRLWAAEHYRTPFDPDHVSVRATPTLTIQPLPALPRDSRSWQACRSPERPSR